MGSGQSQAEEEGGFRIFKVNPGSPAFEAGLEVFFDFIIEINGTKMDSDQNTFFANIQEAEGKRTKLVVYNIRTHQTRDVLLTPRRWGGSGLLGAVVRYDALDNADSQGIRVLDVFPNSPAQTAGLVPNKDYLLGTTEVMFRDMDELVEILNLCLGKRMQIYVYNTDSESIRDVTIVPNTGWGGEGAIGADIRTGLLHRIPPPRRKGISATALAHSAMAASQAPTLVAAQAALAAAEAASQPATPPEASAAAAAQAHAAAQQQAAAAQQAAAMQQQQALAEGAAQAPMLASALVHQAAPEASLASVAPSRPPEAPAALDGMPAVQAAPPELVAAPPPQLAQDVQAMQAAAQAQANAIPAQAPAAPLLDAAALVPVPEAAPAPQLPAPAAFPQTPAGATASLIDGASAVLASSAGQDAEQQPERVPRQASEMLPPRVPPSTPMGPAEVPSYHMDASLDVKSPGVMRIPPDMPTSPSPVAAAAIDVNGDPAGAARALHYDMAAADPPAGFEGAPNGSSVAAAPAYAQQLQQQQQLLQQPPPAAALAPQAPAAFAAPSGYVSTPSPYVLQGAAPGVIYETPPTAGLFGAPAPALAPAPAATPPPQLAAQAAALI